jgi:N4-gp56 family major capsid protein|tara:strand:+ start:724 stop:1662 length:939 start_codon:yes stop_codon:yes gene_type:complete
MALGTAGQTVTTAANFIPELWSDEVIATYKSNLVLGNLVTKINHSGKKGDTIHIPTPTRGSANAKAANTQVVLQGDTHGVTNLSINKHYEYSVVIEDIVEVQSLQSLRRFYTEDAGYALAKQVDDDLFIQSESLQGGTSGANTWAKAVIGGDGVTLYNTAASTNTGNGSDITDAGIRKMILTLDNADVPMDNRCIVLPPIAMNDMLGINRFTEQQYIGDGSAIKTGKIGAIYGMDVFISSNCPVETATDTSTLYRVGLMLHKDALALVEQMGVRSQTQYKQEYLGDLFTSDTLYGVGELRDNAGIAFVVPST